MIVTYYNDFHDFCQFSYETEDNFERHHAVRYGIRAYRKVLTPDKKVSHDCLINMVCGMKAENKTNNYYKKRTKVLI